MDFVLEEVLIPDIVQSNAINAAADRTATRNVMAYFYAACLRCHFTHKDKPLDFKAINAAITARWPNGLTYIKERAWKIFEGKIK